MLAIDVQHLQKHYGEVKAVNDISFSVEQGALFAFLGTNGAGKSTTIEILCTLLEKTGGDVCVNGHALGTLKENTAIRKSIGIVFQQSLLDAQLTVNENIMHRGRFYDLTKQQLAENYAFVSDYLELEDIAHKKYGQLSGGQKRRADIARALIHRPPILFLDEPTTGLDPQSRQLVWAAIERLRAETNMTVFLTTHYMEEAAFADNIIVLKRGKIVAQGSPNELKERYASDQLLLTFQEGFTPDALGYPLQQQGDVYAMKLSSTLEAIDILHTVAPHITSFEVIKGSLDDVFVQIVEEAGERS